MPTYVYCRCVELRDVRDLGRCSVQNCGSWVCEDCAIEHSGEHVRKGHVCAHCRSNAPTHTHDHERVCNDCAREAVDLTCTACTCDWENAYTILRQMRTRFDEACITFRGNASRINRDVLIGMIDAVQGAEETRNAINEARRNAQRV